MIAVDTNILVYAHRDDAEWHIEAKRAIAALAAGSAAWAVPWPCIHEFLSVVTGTRAFRTPTPIPLAVQQVKYWLQAPTLRLIGELPMHWEQLAHLLGTGRIAGARVHDAKIAAICLEHGVEELWTADRDFSRIGALRVRNPLLP